MDHGTMANHQELDLVGNVGALLGFDVIIIEENINELNENMVMKYVCSFLPLIHKLRANFNTENYELMNMKDVDELRTTVKKYLDEGLNIQEISNKLSLSVTTIQWLSEESSEKTKESQSSSASIFDSIRIIDDHLANPWKKKKSGIIDMIHTITNIRCTHCDGPTEGGPRRGTYLCASCGFLFNSKGDTL